ncbi:MAG: DUF4251 domain-containing protein [Bacteroidales bacterium]|nr:DUF4251 domain-containing protein [Bacteroidales bacterium]
MKTRLAIILLAVAALFSSCGTTAVTPAEVARYSNSIINHDLVIDIISIQPSKGAIRYPGGACFFTIKDGTIDGRLPFFGDAFNSLFSGDDVSYVFNKSAIDITENFTKAEKGRYIYTFDAQTAGREKVSFVITFTKSGRADIIAKCTNRSLMTYTGQIR